LSDSWYYADYKGQIGPITLQELKETLPRFSKPENVFVWRVGFTEWVKASDVPELAQTGPPRLPMDEVPTWRVKWWWYPIPFISIAIGSQVGRKVMMWSSVQRRKAREQKRRGA
jgi:GYF domain 2